MDLVLNYQVHELGVFCLQVVNLPLRVAFVLETGVKLRFKLVLQLGHESLHLNDLRL